MQTALNARVLANELDQAGGTGFVGRETDLAIDHLAGVFAVRELNMKFKLLQNMCTQASTIILPAHFTRPPLTPPRPLMPARAISSISYHSSRRPRYPPSVSITSLSVPRSIALITPGFVMPNNLATSVSVTKVLRTNLQKKCVIIQTTLSLKTLPKNIR